MITFQDNIFYRLKKRCENYNFFLKSEIKYTIRNVRKLTKFLSYKGNVKFDEIYDVLE